MNEQAGREEERFKMVCTWCGNPIRRTSIEDSHGMCLKCYSRMRGGHGHTLEREDSLRFGKRK